MARYNGPANNFPDYGYASYTYKGLVLENPLTEYLYSPPAVQTAVALAPGKNKIMAGEKKVVNNPSLAQQSSTNKLTG